MRSEIKFDEIENIKKHLGLDFDFILESDKFTYDLHKKELKYKDLRLTYKDGTGRFLWENTIRNKVGVKGLRELDPDYGIKETIHTA